MLDTSETEIDVIEADRPGLREKYLSVPLPLEQHLVYLGIALAVCYGFVGHYTRMAIEMDRIFSADSRAGAFFMVLGVPFWMGVVLSFRQVRLLVQYVNPIWYWAIVLVFHAPFFYYAKDFWMASFGLIFGTLGSFLFLPITFISYAGLALCVMGRDIVKN